DASGDGLAPAAVARRARLTLGLSRLGALHLEQASPLADLAPALGGVEGEPPRIELGNGGFAAGAAPLRREQPLPSAAEELHRSLPPLQSTGESLPGEIGGAAGPDHQVDGVLPGAGEARWSVGGD